MSAVDPMGTVTEILTPFEIWEVPLDVSAIKFHRPLYLQPTLMAHDSDEPSDVDYLEVEIPALNISAYADNRDDLLDFVRADIRFAWRKIVCGPDSLDPKTRGIKRNYLVLAEEVADG